MLKKNALNAKISKELQPIPAINKLRLSIMKLVECLITVVVAPLGFLFFLAFLGFWFLWTISGIGPLFQWFGSARDAKLLTVDSIEGRGRGLKFISIPADLHSCSMGKSYRMFYAFSHPSQPSLYPPVCIPNGLGANVVLISKLQEFLVSAGFTVLSFDRLGVGLSDENTSGRAPTASDVVSEMEHIMSSVMPPDTKWILLGPSMGSIVSQCYIAKHPHKVVGFLNMDGLPYPFLQQKASFAWAGFVYKIYASIVWTGILRPFLKMAAKDITRMFGSHTFSTGIILALLNQRRFFANVALEMSTMMDCCAMAEREWGTQSLLRLPPQQLEVLVRAPPDESITFTPLLSSPTPEGPHTTPLEQRSSTAQRSPSEVGAQWSTAEEVHSALQVLLGRGGMEEEVSLAAASAMAGTAIADPTTAGTDAATALLAARQGDHVYQQQRADESSLAKAWRGLVVRVMSARSHDFGNALANSFYTQEMRNMAAAEHAVHALLSKPAHNARHSNSSQHCNMGAGRRTVYPEITHTAMFTKTQEIVSKMLEIAHELQAATTA